MTDTVTPRITSRVPVPPPIAGKWKQIAEKMKPGDSVLCKTHEECGTLRQHIIKNGGKATARATENGVRIWRTA